MRLWWAAPALVGTLLTACKDRPPALAVGQTVRRPATAASATPAAAVAAVKLGELTAGSHGPYVASQGERALSVVVAPGAGGAQTWWAQPLGAGGEAAGAAVDLGPAPSGVTLLSLRPGPGDGYLLVWSRQVDGGHVIEARGLEGNGAARGKAATVFQGAEGPSWVDVVSTPAGGHVYFTLASGDAGRVHAVAVGADGASAGATRVVLDGATSWHAASVGAGSLLLAGRATGALVAVPVGEGAAVGAPVEVQRGGVVGGDLEAVSLGDRVVVGWDDRSGADLRVMLAALGPDGRPQGAPQAVLRSAGDQALIGLERGRDGGLLVLWEDLARRSEQGRLVRLSAVPSRLAAPTAEGLLGYALRDGSAPQVRATAWGYGVLTVARGCPGQDDCGKSALTPVFARLGPSFEPAGQAPVRLPNGALAAAAWGLSCGADGCGALAFQEGTTALALRLTTGAESNVPPVARALGSEGPPEATDVAAIARGPRLAEVALAPLGSAWLAATVSDHPEGSEPPALPADADRRAEADKDRARQRNPRSVPARSAIVTVQPLGADGAPAAARTLSVRAMSAPGVAVAPSSSGAEACVAWVARDSDDPEVFLTRVDREGKRLGQQMLTHAKGDVLDVALVPVDDGWLVAWVDTRDGQGEVYAARVDAQLRRKGPEQRVTNAPGDASDLVLLRRGAHVLVAFSDARSDPREGQGDVFVARLRADDAVRVGDEARVAATPDHARALSLQPLGDEALLAWLEQPAQPSAAPRDAQVMLTTLGPDGAVRALPQPLALGRPGPASSLALGCSSATSCRLVVAHPDGPQLLLSAAAWQPGSPRASLHELTPLVAAAAADVTPALGPGWVLVGDDGPPGEGRLRRVNVRWP